MFRQHFGDKSGYVCDGDTTTCTVGIFDCTATLVRDELTHVDDADCYSRHQRARWFDDDWHYVGVCVTVSMGGVQLTGDYAHAVWGVEANLSKRGNKYLRTVANELLLGALEYARATLARLVGAATAA